MKEIINIRAEINEKEKRKQQQRLIKLKVGSLRRLTKLTNHQPDLSRKKGRKIKSIKLEMKQVTTNTKKIQRIRKQYYEQLYANKTDNLEEIDRYLEKISLPRLNQEETEIMNNPITNTEIETVIKNLPKTKAQGLMASQGNSIKHSEKS